jgi:hypothetical protein
MRNMPEEVKQAIWDKYAPRKGEEVDPTCLYVGPLLDGWTEYMPEVARLVVRSGEDNPLAIRHRIKRLIMDVVNPRTKRRDTGGRGEDMAGFGFARIEYKRGKMQTWHLFDRKTLQAEEPGELINSVLVWQDPETGKAKLIAPTQDFNEEIVEIEPRIRQDRQRNLHYLLSGDQFRFTFEALGRTRSLEFLLKPKTEGSSLVELSV